MSLTGAGGGLLHRCGDLLLQFWLLQFVQQFSLHSLMIDVMNTYYVDFEFTRDDGSIYKDTLIAESSTPERAKMLVLCSLGIIRSDIKVTNVRLKTED